MAKSNKPAASAANEMTTVENIYEVLDKGIVATDETLPEKVKEEIKKEADERKVREMKERYQKAQYSIESGLLFMRRDKELARISLAKLTMVGRIARFMMGFTVTDEVITYAKHCADDLFKIEKVDTEAKTITITSPKDKKAVTYKLGDSVPAVIDYVDYDEMYSKIKEDIRKQENEARNAHDKYEKKLQAKYGHYWCRSWYWYD